MAVSKTSLWVVHPDLVTVPGLGPSRTQLAVKNRLPVFIENTPWQKVDALLMQIPSTRTYLIETASRTLANCNSYGTSGHVPLMDKPKVTLSAFGVDLREPARYQAPTILVLDTVTETHRVNSWVASSRREVTCRLVEGRGYHLSVEGVGAFAVKADGSAIALESLASARPDEQAIVETLLGPILLIALAAKGVFCLHASALLAKGRAFVFLGDSGAGKSTLAAYMAGHVDGWQRIADDALPVTVEQGKAVALPHFPQLKLPASEQVGLDMPARIPLGGLYLLDVPTEPVKPAMVPLDRRTAAAILIRHTMATSLFDERLLSLHMDLCTHIAAHVPVRRLIYPHDKELLPEIGQLLAADTAEIS